MTPQQSLLLLWEKYVTDQKMTAAEIRELKSLLQDESNRDLMLELLDSAHNQNTEPAFKEYSTQDAFLELSQKLQLDKTEQPATVVTIQPRNNWWKYAAAAVLITAAGLAFYLSSKPEPDNRVVQHREAITPAAPEIQPGGNKARLTLADGSVVTLDSLQNGIVAKQGGIDVVKLANGELAYQSTEGQVTPAGFNTIVIPRGGKYRLTLPDGSKVWMNAESTLRYPTSFNGKTRNVELTGEAYFEIAKNPNQPFRIDVRDQQIEVLGTHFNVMAYANEASIATTLVEGSVKINSPSMNLTLKPGQQAQQGSSGSLKLVEGVDLQQVLAWKDDYFQLNGDRLDRLMRQLERWYDVAVYYEGPVPERKFGGKISRSSQLKDVLKALEWSDIKFRVRGKTITVINQ